LFISSMCQIMVVLNLSSSQLLFLEPRYFNNNRVSEAFPGITSGINTYGWVSRTATRYLLLENTTPNRPTIRFMILWLSRNSGKYLFT
jgi:hypothetical protein